MPPKRNKKWKVVSYGEKKKGGNPSTGEKAEEAAAATATTTENEEPAKEKRDGADGNTADSLAEETEKMTIAEDDGKPMEEKRDEAGGSAADSLEHEAKGELEASGDEELVEEKTSGGNDSNLDTLAGDIEKMNDEKITADGEKEQTEKKNGGNEDTADIGSKEVEMASMIDDNGAVSIEKDTLIAAKSVENSDLSISETDSALLKKLEEFQVAVNACDGKIGQEVQEKLGMFYEKLGGILQSSRQNATAEGPTQTSILQSAEPNSSENATDSPVESEEEEVQPTDDYERFLVQFADASSARKAILHCSNARIAILEHLANCWKLTRVNESGECKKLFDIFMKTPGSVCLAEFEILAFLTPYATPNLLPECTTKSYAEYAEQFFPGIPVRNYFPELGVVTGEAPYSLPNSLMLKQQTPLVLDPKCFETTSNSVRVEKMGANGKKKKVVNKLVVNPEPIFTKEDLKKCVAVSWWTEQYQKTYTMVPNSSLLLHALSPSKYQEMKPPPRSLEFKLIANEYDEAIKEYRDATTDEAFKKIGPGLAAKYIEKRLESFSASIDPTLITLYEKMKEHLNEEIILDINAIFKNRNKDEQKFERLERILFIKYFDL